jgi:hypothetical protein
MTFEREARPRPPWCVPEIAWFLALAGGCAAAWAGASSGVPVLGAALATLFALAYQTLLVRRSAEGTAGMAAVAAALGVIVATIGLAGQDGWEPTARAFPPAATYHARVLGPLLAGEGGPTIAAAGAGALGAALLLLLARPSRGLFPLAAGIAGAAVLGVAAAAARAAPGEEPSVLTALEHLPPWGLLQVAGLLLAQAGLLGHEPLLPLDELRPARRRLLALGGALLLSGIVLEPLVARPWGAWAAG